MELETALSVIIDEIRYSVFRKELDRDVYYRYYWKLNGLFLLIVVLDDLEEIQSELASLIDEIDALIDKIPSDTRPDSL